MRTDALLYTFILLPVAGYFLSLLPRRKSEGLISLLSFVTVGSHLLLSLLATVYWALNGFRSFDVKALSLFRSTDYEFFLDLHFDKITAMYLLVGAILTFLVIVYSRYYLHREEGYKRFFNTLLFFYTGYNITIFAGNLETLFVGWEILGICSFLLIAFYRDRYLPVKNALKVFTIYRIADIGLILAMWASHHLWHANITFEQLQGSELSHENLQYHSLTGVFISVMILVAAAVKSAQLPFSSWLARAMEGPTPSSAIFYGSLSVHIGCFLLLRTMPFWENQLSVRILIGTLGFATSIVTTLIARVQSSVKSQIAYSSAAQIGLIFIEIALGFENLALFHFAGNAFLRTYQLLVSPSVASYLIREQFYNYTPRQLTIEDSWPKRIEYSIYIMSLKEWNLDNIMSHYIWKPLKSAGKKFSFISLRSVMMLFAPTYLIGLVCLYTKAHIPETLHGWLPAVFSLIGLAMVLKAFTERKEVMLSWVLVIMNHFWICLAISFNENFTYDQVHLYLSGIILAGITGWVCLRRIKAIESSTDLFQFHGHAYEHPRTALVFFIACLAITGFPITPTFIGEDVIFSHIHQDQYFLALFTSLSLIIDGLALIRIFARVFLGPHIKTYHETAYKSS